MGKKIDEKKLIEIIKKSKTNGITYHDIIKKLSIPDTEKKEKRKVKNILKSLVKSKKIIKLKKRYYNKTTTLFTGEFIGAKGGYGFVEVDELEEDIFIPPGKTRSAMDGDLVEVEITKKRKKKGIEGEIVKIKKRERDSLVGFFEIIGNSPYFIPLDDKFQEEIPIINLNMPVLPKMLIEVEFKEKEKGAIVATKIKKIIGKIDDDETDLKAILIKYKIKEKFKKTVLKEANSLSVDIDNQLKKRADLRDEVIFTIDGDDAKDFDDAVSIKKTKNYYILGVHIADVSYFVKPDSSLDKEAQRRGNSVYFPKKAIPMLPEKLSNELCSLKEDVERLTITVEIKISKKGEIKSTKFYPSIIKSKKRLTYREVQDFFDGKSNKIKNKKVEESLLLMKELTEILIKERESRGSIDFDMPEPYLIYEGKVLSAVQPEERLFSHRLIEEFMLCANEAVATFIAKKDVPSIYRIHEEPDPVKLLKLKKILLNFGYDFNNKMDNISEEMQRIINEAKGKEEEKFINILILRAMKLAKYSPYNKGHFALKKEFYTHFTSPIRRYPDLVVHRILKHILKIENGHKYDEKSLEIIARHSSSTERKAESAEYELIKWRIVRFLKSKIGEKFAVRITGFSKNSIIVELEDYFIEGVVPYKILDDYYYFKDDKIKLTGKRDGKEFMLGDKIDATLITVDEIKQKLIFVPA